MFADIVMDLAFFSTGLQVHLICIYNIQCILHVLDNTFCSFAPNTSFALLQVVSIFNLPLMSICILNVIPSPLLTIQACICLDHIQYSHFEGLAVVPI